MKFIKVKLLLAMLFVMFVFFPQIVVNGSTLDFEKLPQEVKEAVKDSCLLNYDLGDVRTMDDGEGGQNAYIPNISTKLGKLGFEGNSDLTMNLAGTHIFRYSDNTYNDQWALRFTSPWNQGNFPRVETKEDIPQIDNLRKYTAEMWINISDFNRADGDITIFSKSIERALRITKVTGQQADLQWDQKCGTNNSLHTVKFTLETGKWYHLALVYFTDSPQGTTRKMDVYVNGQNLNLAATSTTNNDDRDDSSKRLAIGNFPSNWSRPFRGEVGAFRLYNRCLTGEEILEIYGKGGELENAYTPPEAVEKEMVLYYNMHDIEDTIYDYSGKDNHGTISNQEALNAIEENEIFGKVMKFERPGGSIRLPVGNALNNLKSFTIEAYIKPDNPSDNNRIINVPDYWDFYLEGILYGSRNFTANNSISLTTPQNARSRSSKGGVSSSNWNQVAVVYDSTSAAGIMDYYINGELVGTSSTDRQYSKGDLLEIPIDEIMYVGNTKEGNRPFYGEMGPVKIYNYVKSKDEMADSMKKMMVKTDEAFLNTTLKTLTVNGQEITGFNPMKLDYTILKESDSEFEVEALANDTNCIVGIVKGDDGAQVIVTSQGNEKVFTYTISLSAKTDYDIGAVKFTNGTDNTPVTGLTEINAICATIPITKLEDEAQPLTLFLALYNGMGRLLCVDVKRTEDDPMQVDIPKDYELEIDLTKHEDRSGFVKVLIWDGLELLSTDKPFGILPKPQ